MKTQTKSTIVKLLLAGALLSRFSTTLAYDPGQTPEPLKKPLSKESGNLVDSPSAPTLPGGPDQFGYTWDDTISMDWKDATSGTAIVSPGEYVDDDIYGPINLPAGISPFKFYEWAFQEVYISSNGLLGFDESIAGVGASLENLPIPLDYEFPQNILAPFWVDLVIGGEYNVGGIYYDHGTDQRGDYFVVEWHEISRVFSNDLLTFEAVIYGDGTILFQYQNLNGNLDNATVGIEDSDGVDGLQYLYNGIGQPVSIGLSIQFPRPLPDFRTKAFPLNQGGFNIGSWSTFPVYVRNTGEGGQDLYNLSGSTSDPGWQIYFYDAIGAGALWDTNNDGLPDTGIIQPGETFTMTVKLRKPATALVGMGTSAECIVTSLNKPDARQIVQMNTSIPAPFVQTFREGQRIFMELFSEFNSYLALEHDAYRGSSFMMNRQPEAMYLGLWEHNELSSSVTNLYFTFVSSTGIRLTADPIQLTDNQEPGMDIRDYNPTAVSAQNGNIGVVWVRSRMGMDDSDPQTFLRFNRNVYLAILAPDGQSFILPPTNVTNEAGWYDYSDENVPKFEGANICVTPDNFFHLTWVSKHISVSGSYSDIAYAVYSSSNGSLVYLPRLLTSGDPDDNLDYFDPTLTEFNDANEKEWVVLLFSTQNSADPEMTVSSISYFMRDTNGDPQFGPSEIHQGGGYGIDAIQLSDGNLVVVWTDTDTGSDRIAVKLMDQEPSSLHSTEFLYNPDGRPGGNVSVTRDKNGHAILTWIDSKWFQRLYYALVDAGGVVSGPLRFRYSELGATSGLQTNDGFGNAPYDPWFRSVFPLIPR